MIVDAHQHFWQPDRGDYGWLTPDLKPLYRDFLPDDLRPHLTRHGIDGTILVQAAPTIEETRFLLKLADAEPFVLGVVGWVDMALPSAPDHIADLAAHEKLVGLRPMIQDIADDDWMLRAELTPAFEAIIANDLAFDALVLPRHLKNLHHLLERFPGLRTVIDHGAKPGIADGSFEGWAGEMRSLADRFGVHCKISGLVTEAGKDWRAADIKPYIDHLIESFGAERLIWGSDWPVLNLAASYERWMETALALLPQDDRSRIFGENACRFYRLKPQRA